MNIHQFKPGDMITRTEPVYVKQPAEYNPNLGMAVQQEPLVKFDFVGQKLIFLGVANGGINIKVVDGYSYHMPLHKDYFADWSEGWATYEEPLHVDLEPKKEPEMPKRDRNWLWIAWSMVLVVLTALIEAWVTNGKAETPWIAMPACSLTCVLSFIWYYRPAPDWKQ